MKWVFYPPSQTPSAIAFGVGRRPRALLWMNARYVLRRMSLQKLKADNPPKLFSRRSHRLLWRRRLARGVPSCMESHGYEYSGPGFLAENLAPGLISLHGPPRRWEDSVSYTDPSRPRVLFINSIISSAKEPRQSARALRKMESRPGNLPNRLALPRVRCG